MRLATAYSMIALGLCVLSSPVSGEEYYQRFLTLISTNQGRFPQLPQHLVDTNNTGNKVTNSVLNLEGLRLNGEVSGVRLGMTMDQAVARWGKPKGGWPQPIGCLHGLTTFFYRDVALGFDGDRLETIRIHSPAGIAGGLSVLSPMDDFIRLLGAPTNRDDHQLAYLSPAASLRFVFHDEKLQFIWVERTPGRADLRKHIPAPSPKGAGNSSPVRPAD